MVTGTIQAPAQWVHEEFEVAEPVLKPGAVDREQREQEEGAEG